MTAMNMWKNCGKRRPCDCAEREVEVPEDTALVLVRIPVMHALLSAAYFDHLQTKMKIIGITGPKEKPDYLYDKGDSGTCRLQSRSDRDH